MPRSIKNSSSISNRVLGDVHAPPQLQRQQAAALMDGMFFPLPLTCLVARRELAPVGQRALVLQQYSPQQRPMLPTPHARGAPRCPLSGCGERSIGVRGRRQAGVQGQRG